MRARWVWLFALHVVPCVGCDGAGGAMDAGVDADLPDPALVDIPWLVRGNPPLEPSPEHACPEGFRGERTDTGVLTCRPWPEGGPMACSGVEAHFPGEPGCARVGTACPSGEFPEGLPTDRPTLYVRAGASGGDGSRARPFGTLDAAIVAAAPNTVIAVARGTYDGRADVFEGITIWGACPEETILTSSAASEADTVLGAFFGTGELRNVTVRAPVTMGVFVSNGASLRLEDVVIDGASGYGIYASEVGTRVTLERVIVRDAATFPSGNGGVGVQAVDGASLEGRRVAIERSAEIQLVVAFDSAATLERAVLRDALGSTGVKRTGTAVAVQEGGALTLTASAVWGHPSTAILSALGSSVTVTDVAIEASIDATPSLGAPALEVRVGSTLTGSHVHVEGARGAALTASEDGAFTLTDVVVRDTRPARDLDDNGAGMSLEGQSSATIRRALFEGNRRVGIVTRPLTRLTATDLVVRDTEGAGPRGLGVGLVLFGAEHTFERAVIERSTVVGVAISEAPRTVLRDVVIRDTRGDGAAGVYGRGLEVNLGSVVETDRLVLERNREVSLYAFDPGTAVTARDLYVRDSLGQACAEACPDGQQYGYGITALLGARVELTGFVVTRSRLVGLQVAEEGRIVGTRGEVSAAPIGMNVQDPAYDLASSLPDVAFRDNERNVDSMFLPVPDTGLSPDL